jgi:hypothetical protein
VPLIGVHLTGYASHRQPSSIRYLIGVSLMGVHLLGVHPLGVHPRRVSPGRASPIGVHLIGVIGVVGVHLIGVCLRHQVWRSVSILVSVWIGYRRFSAILVSYRYSMYFCRAWAPFSAA